MLKIHDLNAWYGESHIINGIDLAVDEGELVTLIGKNGVGKSTTIKAIMGLVSCRTGSIEFRGRQLTKMAPHQIARQGIGYCPEERGVFASLSVLENLRLPPVISPGGLDEEAIFTLFPNLYERRNSPSAKLSGGEQQMIAIARILRTGARLLLLDEPTEGLAPAIIQQMARTISEIKRRGFTILLVEQNFRFVESIADRHYVIERGKIVDQFTKAECAVKREVVQTYISV